MEPTESSSNAEFAGSTTAPRRRLLFVDLEGGLLASQLDWEAVVKSVRRDGWNAARVPLWWLTGRARLRQRLLAAAQLEIDELPYRASVQEFVRQRRSEGWQTVLVASSSAPLAHAIAEAADLFDEVIVVDDAPAAGDSRSGTIQRYLQDSDCATFSHLGSSQDDLPVWSEAHEAILVGPSESLESQVRQLGRPVLVLDRQDHSRSWPSLFRAMRPHHWVKNVLVFAPVIFHHSFESITPWLQSGLAFLLFCLTCSAIYILNDLLDLPSDRRHPVKCKRPFAAGKLTVRQGLITAASLLTVSGAVALAVLPVDFALVLGGYVVLNVLYSTWLKRKVMIDILVLAGFYSIRLLAGGAATGIVISEWLIALSMFLFLSMAFLKRHGELLRLHGEGLERTDNRGYRVQDLAMIETLGAISGYMAVLILALYINGEDVVELYTRPRVLWLVCPALLYWFSRVWIWARRGVLAEDPLMFALRDRVSWTTLIVIVLLAWLAL